MAQFDDRSLGVETTERDDAVDEGLRSYMLRVYNYMAGGVALSGLVAYAIFALSTTGDPALAASSGGNVVGLRTGLHLTPFGYALFATPLMWIVALAPLAFVILLSWRIDRMSVGAANVAFWLFAAVMGASLSTIFLRFTATSISQVFFIAASTFGALSVLGYVTRKDLSGWGAFLIMGVVGIVIAALVNIFLQSSALQFAISVIGVLVFGALTAYDTQRIKDNYVAVQKDGTAVNKAAIMGALSLYLDFINLFVSLLQLLGNRQE